MLKKHKIIVLSFLFFAVIFATYFFYILSPVAAESGELTVLIKQGSGIKDIAAELHSRGLIRSIAGFKLYAIISGSAHRLKPGEYLMSSNLSSSEIVKRLVNGPPDFEILITEGMTLKEIDARLSSLNLITAGELVNFPVEALKAEYPFLGKAASLEGFLFPDTYRIAPKSEAGLIVRKFLDNFKNKALPELEKAVTQFQASYQLLIMASLIEKEVPFFEDRLLVSGILWKRLALGMPLQVDATVLYAKCNTGKNIGSECAPLTRIDYQLKSVFNTYYRSGLPPAPIANPGITAIKAASAPKTSEFLYYLSDPETRKTVFAKTLQEHNANRARHLNL